MTDDNLLQTLTALYVTVFCFFYTTFSNELSLSILVTLCTVYRPCLNPPLSSTTQLLCILPFHRSTAGPITHLLVLHIVVTTFHSTTPVNRQINATIKSTHRLWWHSSKTVYMTSSIKDLMKSDFQRANKSVMEVQSNSSQGRG